jgi:hypothetical protein
MILNVHRRIWAKILNGKRGQSNYYGYWALVTTQSIHLTISNLHDYGKWHQNIIPYVLDYWGKQNTFKFS